MIELKTYAGSNVTPQNDAIMNDTNTLNNGIYYGCNVTIKDATTLHITAGQGIVYGRLFEVLDSDIPVSLSPSGTLLGQLYVHVDLSNIAAPIQILVDTGETLADLEDDPQLNIDSGITDMQLATFTVSTVGMSDLVETFAAVEPIRAVLGDADISAIGDGSVKGAIRTINMVINDELGRTRQDITDRLENLSAAVAEQNLGKYGYAIGDYFVGNSGYKYFLGDLNTFYGGYDSYAVLATPHIGVVVDTGSNSQWNTSDSTASGYAGSKLHSYLTTTVLNNIKSDFTALFGSWNNHLLSHQKLLTTATSNWGWSANQYISALTEPQIYGTNVCALDFFSTGEAMRCLEIFRKYCFNEIFGAKTIWLRSISSAAGACGAAAAGNAYSGGASGSSGAVGLILFY